MSEDKFDVVIIGGGNAGIGVTGPVRRAGLSVAMIESRDLGGTCPNRGCTPKKVLVAAGQALRDIERARRSSSIAAATAFSGPTSSPLLARLGRKAPASIIGGSLCMSGPAVAALELPLSGFTPQARSPISVSQSCLAYDAPAVVDLCS
jgi:hypothetical protein